MSKYLIIGQSSIGKQVAIDLSAHHPVVGVSRSDVKYDADEGERLTHWQQNALSLTADKLQDFTHIAIIVAPSGSAQDRVQAYQDSYLAICQHVADMANSLPNLCQVLFVSSTSVYGDDDGARIDEKTLAVPSSPTAQVLLTAENALRQAFGIKSVIVRASGIYGKNRQRMLRLAACAHIDGVAKTHYTNRIMDVDLVAVLVRILLADNPKSLYLASDFCPVPSSQVLAYLCKNLGFEPPKIIQAPVTGKQIVSNLPKDWLRFADYQQGYAWILQNLDAAQEY